MEKRNAELLRIGENIKKLGSIDGEVSEERRVLARLLHDPMDLDILAPAVLKQVENGSTLSKFLTKGPGVILLHFMIAHVSHLYWEDLWNEKHSNRLGQAWDGEDFELMAVWRDKVDELFSKCRQVWVFEVKSVDEYVQRLSKETAKEEIPEELVEWFAQLLAPNSGGDKNDV